VECSVRRIRLADEQADWSDAFVRERLTSSADACSDIWVLEPHGLTFEPHALPTLSLRLGAVGCAQTFVRIESTYPLPLSSHWQAVRGGTFEAGWGHISLSGFSCWAVACCEVDCFIWPRRVSAEDTSARVFLGAVPWTESIPANLSRAHQLLRSNLPSVADDYECHQHPLTMILADEVTYKLRFDGARSALDFKWKHLADGEALFTRELPVLHLNPETTFADLPGSSSGRIVLTARLTKAESRTHGVDFHKDFPPRLADWSADELLSFFRSYPDAYDQAVRSVGDVCYNLRWTGRRLEQKKDLVAFLRKKVVELELEDAQMLVKDLGCFVSPEYDVTIEFRTSKPGTWSQIDSGVHTRVL
jgi:hypothetical protein